MTDARSYYEEQLMPIYELWLKQPESDALAKSVAQNANNMATRFAHHLGLKEREYREQLAATCPEFGFVWDVAEGTKHVVLKRDTKRVSHINQAHMSKNFDDWGRVDEVRNWDEHAALVVTDDRGNRHNFPKLMDAVLATYQQLLADHGL
jgi:gluconate kinase